MPAAKRRRCRLCPAPALLLIALFFAVLHLGVLVLGTGDLSGMSGVYLVGLMVALLALILG